MVPPKPVPPALAKKLADAQQAYRDARTERDQLIVEALRGGAGLRAIGDAVGLSYTQVGDLAKAAGWPDAAELKRREDEARKRRQEREQLDRDIEAYKRNQGRT